MKKKMNLKSKLNPIAVAENGSSDAGSKFVQ